MLATAYDSIANELIATTTGFGEFVFGETDLVYTAQAPIPNEPKDRKKVLAQDSLALRWSGKGFYDQFQVQVSTFGIMIIDSTLNSSFLWLDNLESDVIYFWRVRAVLGSDKSDWSPIWRFEPTNAFIQLTTPNGGEKWSQGESMIIRWETNTADSVRLDLYKTDQHIATIGKTPGSVNAFAWDISTELVSDSSYKIHIMSIEDSAVADTSDAEFSLIGPSGLGLMAQKIPAQFSLFQNYPNPFNPSTRIRWQLAVGSNVELTVYNLLGEKVAELVSARMNPGNYNYNFDGGNLPSGVYYYQLVAGAYREVRKMILLK